MKDQADSAKHYFRGVQTTDANGRVDFNSCFPGWYRGRAIHVHLEVTVNGRSYVTQVGFDQALIMFQVRWFTLLHLVPARTLIYRALVILGPLTVLVAHCTPTAVREEAGVDLPQRAKPR